jgi:hypothetical protein
MKKDKPTKRERLMKKATLKAKKAAAVLAKRKVVKSKLSKKQLTEKRELFSLKAYLFKKAQLRALKLQFREARRVAKKDGNTLSFEDFVASLQQAAPVAAPTHEHGEHCDHDHDHEVLEVVEEQS